MTVRPVQTLVRATRIEGADAPYDTAHVKITYPALDADPVDPVGTLPPVHPVPAGSTKACGEAGNPMWTTTYSPSQTVAQVPAGETVTIINTLDCEPIKKDVGTFTITKKIDGNVHH